MFSDSNSLIAETSRYECDTHLLRLSSAKYASHTDNFCLCFAASTVNGSIFRHKGQTRWSALTLSSTTHWNPNSLVNDLLHALLLNYCPTIFVSIPHTHTYTRYVSLHSNFQGDINTRLCKSLFKSLCFHAVLLLYRLMVGALYPSSIINQLLIQNGIQWAAVLIHKHSKDIMTKIQTVK